MFVGNGITPLILSPLITVGAGVQLRSLIFTHQQHLHASRAVSVNHVLFSCADDSLPAGETLSQMPTEVIVVHGSLTQAPLFRHHRDGLFPQVIKSCCAR